MHAQEAQGVVGNLRVESSAPGVLVVSWEAPGLEPTDYRVAWAEASLEFLSYASANEAQRGNEYPSGEATSLTLSDLNPGATYKVQMRARYSDGDYADEPWSGPWTAEQALRVRDHRSAAPSGLRASPSGHDTVTLTWTAPAGGAVSGYRVLRGPPRGPMSVLEDDTASTDTRYTDTTVAAQTTYVYAVAG